MVFSLDPIVFVYVAAVCLGTAVLFGLAPALQVSKTDVNDVLKEGTRGGSGGVQSRRLVNAFVIGQVVLTVVLLSGAVFFTRSFMSLYAMDSGFETDGLLTMQIYLPLTKYPQAPEQLEVHTNLIDRLQGLSGTAASAIASSPPIVGGGQVGVELDGRVAEPEETPPRSSVVTVSEDYFATLGLPILQGRAFNRADGEPGSETLIVNQRFVAVHLEGGNALGRRVRLGASPDTDPGVGWMTIVGVVPDVRQGSSEDVEIYPGAYRPLRGNPGRSVVLLVRVVGDPAVATSGVRQAMRAVEPDVPVFDVATMDELLAEARWPFRVFGLMFSVFAVAALLLSSVGLYSITAHSVIQRTREFGIRISLGAEPREISRLALRRVLNQLAIGIPIGIAGAYGVGNLLQGLLVQSTPGDPLTLGGIAFLLVAVAIAACTIPARRAAALDPVTALRVE
jgi:putative ABC transport system permease protein